MRIPWFSHSAPRRKVTWGSQVLLSPLFALIVTFSLSVPAPVAAQSTNANKSLAAQAAAERKIDRELLKRAAKAGDTDVIVEFVDGLDDTAVLRGFGKAGRRLEMLKARVLRIPNGQIRKLAEHPRVKRIVHDREVAGDVALTAAAIGSRAVVDLMGYTGAGIGVAVIDSGISNWHNDLRIKGYGQTQPTALTLPTV
jgi:hypothetical protein